MIITSHDYLSYVYESGGFPVLVSPLNNDEYLKSIIENTDILLLSGGEDTDSSLYNQVQSKYLGIIVPKRDEFEMKLVRLFLEANKPIFGICRGFQLLNTYFNGTLYQDYRYLNENLSYHCEQPYQKLIHEVTLSPYLENIFGEKEISVNSHHHQFIDKLGDDLEVIAVAKDGVIEAIRNKSKKILAVQWHPEMLFKKYSKHSDLLRCFIELQSHS